MTSLRGTFKVVMSAGGAGGGRRLRRLFEASAKTRIILLKAIFGCGGGAVDFHFFPLIYSAPSAVKPFSCSSLFSSFPLSDKEVLVQMLSRRLGFEWAQAASSKLLEAASAFGHSHGRRPRGGLTDPRGGLDCPVLCVGGPLKPATTESRRHTE